ncbi:Ribonuclease J2 (endoribonuclease in RNA processing) [Alkalibacterium sp. AK22]|uniref:ribonuclease J n=1 Tax=Alkalibacterium sp. AK22 TaxID=1229520 RepID=UPI0004473DFE|nr:ribonuclease J [Alkalibacterium sp. AK22]EXJ24253.1 Ribonuclease J2 (endoribonuclease in RNA processing) [Alkalibacterium sp. AK22]
MSNIKIIPLGGVRENGKNLYVIESEEDIFVLDCGLMYPEDELFGIDAIIPDFSYLEENKDKITGVFLTHGHEDAIGALPYFLDTFNVPVFGSELTIALAKLFVEQSNFNSNFDDFHVIDEHTEIDFNGTTVKFFRTTHTIPDSMGIAVHTEEGNIVYTGNFKFDQSSQNLYKTDLSQISDLGKEGVLALLSDSGDAESPVENVSEKKVQEEVLDTFQNTSNRIIVAAVASNILRIQQVLNAAHQSNRKVFISGRNLEAILRKAMELDKLTLPDDHLIVPIEEIEKYGDDQILVLETGSAGEPIKTLNRMATNNHDQVNIKEGDLIFIATSPSTAMEVTVAETENLIYRAGGTVVKLSSLLKASGHATPNDLQLMINLLHPTYFIPIQGEYRMLAAHAELANETGIPFKNIFILSNGDVVSYVKGKMKQSGQVSADNTLIDGIGIGDIGNIVLRDRRLLSEDGIFVAVVTIDRKKKRIVSDPHIVTRGFVFVKENQALINESTDIVKSIVKKNLKHNDFDWGSIKQDIREGLNNHLFKKTKRRPIILPVIMEVNQNRRFNR